MIRSSQDVGAGLFLVGIAAVGLWQSAGLSAGTLHQVGPGMLPRALSVLTGVLGLALLAKSIVIAGHKLDRWPLRGPLFILGAIVLFGLTVRPLGLAVAGPLAVAVGAAASRRSRWVEAGIFCVAITVFCVVLFKFLLRLPIPLAPWLIGY
jgi:putative tricarboxylic transport membrane protein